MFGTPISRRRRNTEYGDSKSSSKSRKGSIDRFFPKKIDPGLFEVMSAEKQKKLRLQSENKEMIQDGKLNSFLVENEKKRYFDMLLQKEVIRKPLWTSFKPNSKQSRLLNYSDIKKDDFIDFNNFTLEKQNNKEFQFEKEIREISNVPYKILDAPGLQDDFYLNVLDWTRTNKVVVALGDNIYNWCPLKGKAAKIYSVNAPEKICSIKGNLEGDKIAFGFSNGEVGIFDCNKQKIERVMKGQLWRTGCISWSINGLCTGSRDKSICIRDLRLSKDFVTKLVGHKQEVCGLEYSPSFGFIASGGNDNKFCVWDTRKNIEVIKSMKHKAAVKAIAWNPHKHNSVLSGGGTHDQTIKLWNVSTSSIEMSIDSGSQVCAMKISPNYNELVSSHGYSQNLVNVWKMGGHQEVKKIAVLKGHTSRVLFMAMSPEGEKVVTGAGDESLRFWDVFPKVKKEDIKKNLFQGFEMRSSFSELR